MARVIKHEYFFAHPPATVWDYLTKADLMAQWLMPNNFEPVEGHEFQFTTNPKAEMDFDGVFHCKVLAIEPFSHLSYTWNCGPGNGMITLESVVEWKLEAKDKGTQVYLKHSGFGREENMGMFNGLNHGWTVKFVDIEKLINEAYGNSNA